ncbi:enoyl-CoA hydratase/isomerase family protein [Pseudoalteromonas sp. JBTF-M23]|uniref:Enoyl-CoA hydratase/isomerase family protein n=1 Tax=Pseudoalteromonas caenipelagi TaxID=2726988 RepID=A0A849VLS7_9GAMM|nr:enoyl-CoA hydratase/isomerase family protein [Pseudoalteromonas caenipelagi]NOU52631.1 enoyl-CoA hydratase/isomerase family protein [Pseudoalteromonas caenipelagi]
MIENNGMVPSFSKVLGSDICIIEASIQNLLGGGHQKASLDDTFYTLMEEFFSLHAVSIYKTLTNEFSLKLRVGQLANAFYEQFPRLIPQIAGGEQEEVKDLISSLFLSEVLGSEDAGMHLVLAMLAPKESSYALLQEFITAGKLVLPSLMLEKQGDAGIITFLNQDTLNAEDDQLVADFETVIDIVYLADHIKVGVLRGGTVNHPKYQGKRVFSAGINLKYLHYKKITFLDFLIGRELGCVNKLIHGVRVDKGQLSSKLHAVDKPWISAVDTFAIGGGMQLLLVSDYVIGEKGCYANLPAAKEGIIPGVANLRLATIATDRLAKQVILHGQKVWASSDEGKLIFDEVVEKEDMDKAIDAAIELMSAPAVVANKKMLTIAREPLAAVKDYMHHFSKEQAKRKYAEDVKNKVSQFTAAAEIK